MTYTAIIVDDEPPARKRVTDLLRGELDIRVAAHCSTATEAMAALRAHRPDLVFLDIQMPGASGFDALTAVPEGMEPAIVVTTAHGEHALRAFGADAVDYLLKPYSRERFHRALTKARQFLQGRHGSAPSEAPSTRLRRIFVRDGARIVFLKPTDIDWAEAAGNYVELHAGKALHLLRATLSRLEAQLPAGQFLRVSRSALVNVERIRELQAMPGGHHAVILHDGQCVPMSRPLPEVRADLGLST